MILPCVTGLNWFKRVYVTSTNWENTQDITLQNGDFYSVHGTSKFNLYDLVTTIWCMCIFLFNFLNISQRKFT